MHDLFHMKIYEVMNILIEKKMFNIHASFCKIDNDKHIAQQCV